MSGIFGIYHPDSRPINPSHLEGMADGSAHRGPDGTKTVIQQHIGFGHSMLHTTPESITEILPYEDPKSGVVITADARIDNRGDLFRSLGMQHDSCISDSQLIIEAYKKWEANAFTRFIGDFAFVLWDPSKQKLFCVRDYIGVKPLYFYSSQKQFLFGSEIKQIAEYPGVQLKPNENIVAEYLSFSFFSKTETLFDGISRLAPAHYLEVTSRKISSHRYWSFDTTSHIYYKKTSDYTEHFLEIFERSVSSKLRSTTPVCAELSGGLDSSSVVGMASKLLKKDGKLPLQIYSMTFPGLAIDEQQYIRAVSGLYNLKTHYIDSLHPINLDANLQVQNSYEPPDIPNITMCNNVYNCIKASKARVVLSGIGGDQWLTGSGYPYLDFIRNGDLKKFFSHTKHSFSISKSRTAKLFSVNMLWPLIPKRLKYAYYNNRGLSLPPWLSDSFITKTALSDRIQKNNLRPLLTNLSKITLLNVTHSAHEVFFLESTDRHHSRYQIEYRSPFLDRRIAEFAISVPEYERQRNGQIKFLLRNNANRLLPELIRNRRGKAEFSYLFNQAIINKIPTIKRTQTKNHSTEWILRKEWNLNLKHRQERYAENPYQHTQFTWETWFGIAIGIWKNVLFGNRTRRE